MSHPYFFVSEDNISEEFIEITGDDLVHLGQVLRAKKGEIVEVSDNLKYRYITELAEIRKNKAELKILKKSEIKRKPVEIFLYQCLLKRSSMELVIQKASEIGADMIIPVKSRRVVVNEKVDNRKFVRWQKIALEASKQCKRDFKCEVFQEISITEIKPDDFDVFYLPYEEANAKDIKKINFVDSIKNLISGDGNNLKTDDSIENSVDQPDLQDRSGNKNKKLKIGFLIGPEGGFEEKEIEYLSKNKALSVSLGSNILKAETAAIFMSSIIKYLLEIY
ncbi:16S rRNA (uracil(1498)-N(3))-methyltransferase [bacterium]|nr:16S rRNA (uracil(1498)-N(3))-methyltransferase [bacterium]